MKRKQRPQEGTWKDDIEAIQKRKQLEEIKRKTEELTFYSVTAPGQEIDNIVNIKEAENLAKKINGKVWSCWKEGKTYIKGILHSN